MLRKWDEAPIAGPGVVQNAEDQCRFLIEAGFVDFADSDARVALSRLNDPLHQRRQGIGNGKVVSVQVLHPGITGRLDPSLVSGAVVAHHHGGRMIESFDEEARFVPDRQAVRPLRAAHSAAAEEVLGAGDQRRGHLLIGGLEHAPLAQAFAHILQNFLVDLRRDPSNRFPIPLGEEEAGFGMREPRVGARIDQAVNLGFQGRHPVRVIPVELPGKVHECLPVRSVLNGPYRDRTGKRGGAS